MKKLCWVLVILQILITSACGESMRINDADTFEIAISTLRQMDSRESVEDAKSLFEQITSKFNQSNLFAIYADAILDIYDENYELAQTKTDVLSMNDTFVELLKEYDLQGCDVLQQYIAGRRLEEAGNYREALAVYATMNFYDSPERMIAIMDKAKEQSYNYAQALFESGVYDQAAEVFKSLGNYKDSAEMAEKAIDLFALPAQTSTKEPISTSVPMHDPTNSDYDIDNDTPENVEVVSERSDDAVDRHDYAIGSTVVFGSFDQDNDAANGAEPIDWMVLENDGETCTMISIYGLDSRLYNTVWTGVTWETCTLRNWLNNEFLNAAFTVEEQARMETVTVTADQNPNYNTDPGNDTQDKVFLLSIDEVNRYFAADDVRVCMPTQTAVANGAWPDDVGACWWWLRSPGRNSKSAARVLSDGSVYDYGNRVIRANGTVRPVVVLRLT